MFQHIEAFAGDPILTLNEQFAADPRADKINLSIGVYLNDEQRIPLMGAVAAAEARLAESFQPHPYLPRAGLAAYREQSRRLVFGDAHGERIATIQTLGGYGYVSDFPVERIYRDVRVCQIYEGSSDVQKILITRALA